MKRGGVHRFESTTLNVLISMGFSLVFIIDSYGEAKEQIVALVEPLKIAEAARLMQKYADTPMDFADATLVLLANELGALEVATLDTRGFSAYRTVKGKAFRLVLS